MAELSVIVPIYNVEKYLCKCLDSIVNQTFNDMEIILIDDGSPDNCGQICDNYAANDDRIRVIHKKNAGLCAARNDGIYAATGKYITFVDSDDWLDIDIYEKMMSGMEKYKANLITCNYYRNIGESESINAYFNEEFVTEDDKEIKSFQLGVINRFYFKSKIIGINCIWNKIFERNFIISNKLHFEDVQAYEDNIFSVSVFQYARKVAFLPIQGYHYRFNPVSITIKYTPNRVEIDKKVLKTLFDMGQEFKAGDEYYRALYPFVVWILRQLSWRCIFHKDNPMSFSMKIKSMRQLIKSEPFSTALEKSDINLLENMCKPCAIFKTHSTYYLYFLYVLTCGKRKLSAMYMK